MEMLGSSDYAYNVEGYLSGDRQRSVTKKQRKLVNKKPTANQRWHALLVYCACRQKAQLHKTAPK